MMKNEVVSRLRKFIKYKNLTIKDFCLTTGIPEASFKTMSQRGSNPKVEMIESIVAAFPELDLNWLITNDGEMCRSEGSLKIFVPDDLPKEVGRLYRAPIYESYPVSAGLHGLAAVREDKPDGYAYTSMPGVTFFPVVGCSFEPLIYAGQYIGVIKLNSWDRVDTEKVYYVLTREERMLKRLRVDENDDSILWCVSPNFKEFKIQKDDIIEISHVFFYGKMI